MKKLMLYFLALTLVLITQANTKAKLTTFFNNTDSFLKTAVVSGKVKYPSIKNKPATLNSLIATIGTMNLHGASENEKKAFYINAYNLTVIKAVINSYPIEKPLDVDGFFDAKKYKIAGEDLTLNDIENKKVRIYKDARIHFVLVCAAKGCPAIVNYAYRPAKLEAQLQERTAYALNDINFIRVKPNTKTIYISEIFKWYKQDFLDESKSLVAFINNYRKDTNKLPTSYTVNNYPYNWKLNVYK